MIAKILGWVRDKEEGTILMRCVLMMYVFASMGTVCPVVIADDSLVVELGPTKFRIRPVISALSEFACRLNSIASRSRSPSRPGW